nr:biotin--[acetyl-CoA-carboxylase] ligase [Gloeothece citriformis]
MYSFEFLIVTLNQHQLDNALTKMITPEQREQLSFYLYDRIESTNDICWKLIEQGNQTPLIVIATEQTAGRGQWGRIWQSPPGGLYLSLGLSLEMSALNAPHLTLWSAWGICESLHHHHIPLFLKWPNDLILERRKLGGIKTETRIHQEIISSAVIGVGINWSNSVPQTGINLYSWIKDQRDPPIHSLEELAALTITGILIGYERYRQKGIKPILEDYLKRLQSQGKRVMVNGSPGIVVGVTPQGELQVQLYSSGARTMINLPPGSISLGYD